MFSDAGGGDFRRRRDFLSCCCSLSLTYFSFLLLFFSFRFFSLGSNHSQLSFPETVRSTTSMLSSFSELRPTSPGSDHFLGNPRRNSIILLRIHDCISRESTICLTSFDFNVSRSQIQHGRGVSWSQLIFNRSNLMCIPQIQFFTELAFDLIYRVVEFLVVYDLSLDWVEVSLNALKPLTQAKLSSIPITVWSATSRHSGSLNVYAKRNLGFGRLGLLYFGPFVFSLWTIVKSGGPLPFKEDSCLF